MKQQINEIINHIKLPKFGKNVIPSVHLSDDTLFNGDIIVQGSINIYIEKEGFKRTLIHKESLYQVSSIEEFKDRLANSLSKVLYEHDNWLKILRKSKEVENEIL